MSQLASASAALTTAIVNPLLESIVETFSTMLDATVERRDLSLRELGATLYDVTAVIGISGRAKGVVCMSFPRGAALRIAEQMLGERQTALNPDVIDALGEVANMVGGGAKSKLNVGLNIGLPSVVQGHQHTIDFPVESCPMRLKFDSSVGPFVVDFGFVSRTGGV
jgi:chemotaxis protein CheX